MCEFHYCPRCFPLPHGQRTVFRFQAVPVGKVFGKRGKFRFVVSRKIVDARKSDFLILVLNCLLVCSRWVKGYCEILTSVGGFLAVSRDSCISPHCCAPLLR